MYTTNWIVVTWRRNWGVTWYGGWGNFLLVTTLLSLLSLHLVKVKLKYFWFDTWPLDRSVKWLCWWGPFTLSHHFAKFGIQRPWESEDITCVICHVTMYLKCHVTCGGSFLILSQHHAKFGVHKSCESGDKTFFICHTTTISKYHVTLWVGSSHPKSPPC